MSTIQRATRAEAAEQTAARLVATARRAFAERGFARVSLDALAAETGVTRGALHHHFTTQSGLFEAVLRAVDAEIAQELDRLYEAEKDRWKALRSCFHAYLDLALRPDRRRILFRDAPAVLGTRTFEILMASGFGPMVSDLRGLVAEGRIRTIDPEAVAHALNGVVMAQVMWLAEAEDNDGDRLAAAHAALDAVFDGLTAGSQFHCEAS